MHGTPRCPICRKPARWHGNPYRPFCSDRCRRLDLGNWASERYSIPGEPAELAEVDEELEEEEPTDPDPDLWKRRP
jgi:hypothetical protein